MLQKNIIFIVFLIFLSGSQIKTINSQQLTGLLCVIEGIDGSGKTTLLKKLEQKFAKTDFNPFFTKEPGATNIGKQLRSIILNKEIPLCPFTEFLLFAADRAQHFQEYIIPKLCDGKIIISDRMADSSMVYQGYLKGIDFNKINTINSWCMQNMQPDVVFYLKISSHDAKNRIQETRGFNDKFEEELIHHLDKLVHAFDTVLAHRQNVIIIDALQDPETVANIVFNKIVEIYKRKLKN